MSPKLSLAALALAAALPFASVAFGQMPDMTVTFTDPAWNGETVPDDQHCPLQGGVGATPALHITNVPEGAATIRVSFNDESYEPMNNGGHGVLDFAVTPTEGQVDLPSVPGNTADALPEGVSIAEPGRGTGDYASPGYMPPCSGGQGNTYSADVSALDASGNEVAHGKITLGKY